MAFNHSVTERVLMLRPSWLSQGWQAAGPNGVAENSRRDGRCGFYGERHPGREALYLGGDVSALLSPGAQNPLKYVNCWLAFQQAVWS